MIKVLKKVTSNSLPKNKFTILILSLILLGLFFAPFLVETVRGLHTAAYILIFIIFALSYDLLLGYTGIVSFAHHVFFAIGAYACGLSFVYFGSSFWVYLIGLLIAQVVSVSISLLISFISLRVKEIFFALITLSIASVCGVLIIRFSGLTGGEDGLNFEIPFFFKPSYVIFEVTAINFVITGRILLYYFIFFCMIASLLFFLKLISSSLGQVLKAIRENEFRTAALGYQVISYKIISCIIASSFATFAGSLLALWLRFISPENYIGIQIMIDLLLIVIIGGLGSMYGVIIGSSLLIIAQNYLEKIMSFASKNFVTIPYIENIINQDRWLLILGILFILSIYFFPKGIYGLLEKQD